MADPSEKKARSIAEEVGEDIVGTVQTPSELFFMTLFVIGVLSIASTTLVGDCGNVDDDAQYLDPRTTDIIPGAVVFTTSSVVFGEFIAEQGVCGVVEQVDEEKGVAKIHLLAKAQPGFLENPKEYRPTQALDGLLSHPLSSIFFLHSTPPTGEVPLHQLGVIPTQTYTNWFRHFYLTRIYVVMLVLALLVGALGYIGYRYEKKRTTWYQNHTLRSQYRARLLQDRGQVRALRESFSKVELLVKEENPTQWREALTTLDEILEAVLVLLRFEGITLTEKLQGMKKEDLFCIEELWEAHSLIIRMQGQVEQNEPIPPITEKAVQHVFSKYKKAFIWLGLLEHYA